MFDLTRSQPPSPSKRTLLGLSRQSDRRGSLLHQRALDRIANVRAESVVQASKVHEIDQLTREAMTGQAFLAQWRTTLAAGDPFVADELSFFVNLARIGKGEIIADTVATFCRESSW